MMARARRALEDLWAPALAIGIVVVLLALMSQASLKFPFPDTSPIPFERDAWLRWGVEMRLTDPTRLRMADSLLESKRLIGLTRSEVMDLLGPADGAQRNPHFSSGYIVGTSLMSPRDIFLVMEYGPRATVARALILPAH